MRRLLAAALVVAWSPAAAVEITDRTLCPAIAAPRGVLGDRDFGFYVGGLVLQRDGAFVTTGNPLLHGLFSFDAMTEWVTSRCRANPGMTVHDATVVVYDRIARFLADMREGR